MLGSQTGNKFSREFDCSSERVQTNYVNATAYNCKERKTGSAKVAYRFEVNRLGQLDTKNLLFETAVLGQMNHEHIIKTSGCF